MLRQTLQVSDIDLKKLMKAASKKIVHFLYECFLNVVNGNVPISKTLIENQKTSFIKILSKKASLKEKKKIFVRELELLKTVAFSCYVYLNTA